MGSSFSLIRSSGQPAYSLLDGQMSVVAQSDDAADLMQQAVNAPGPVALSLGGGTFELTKTVTLSRDSISVIGSGSGTVLRITGDFSALAVAGTEYAEIASLAIRGPGERFPFEHGIGINADKNNFLNVHDVTVSHCRLGMRANNLFKPRYQNITVRWCHAGIEASVNEFRLMNANIEAVSDVGLDIKNATGAILTQVEIGGDPLNIGLRIDGLTWGHFSTVLVDTVRFAGWQVRNSTGIQMSNCWAGTITSPEPVHGTAVELTDSKQMILSGMQIRPPYSTGIVCRGCSDITITSSQFSHASDTAIWLDRDVTNSVVVGNIARGCKHGIKETGNCDYNNISLNDVNHCREEKLVTVGLRTIATGNNV